MKEGFEPKLFKNYNLTPAEQIKLDKFLKENLEKGYIRPSQSLMASPFFFVNKKDRKLWPCQDYQYLNNWTIKNSYLLRIFTSFIHLIHVSQIYAILLLLTHFAYLCAATSLPLPTCSNPLRSLYYLHATYPLIHVSGSAAFTIGI